MAWEKEKFRDMVELVLKYHFAEAANTGNSIQNLNEIMSFIDCLLSTSEENAFKYLDDYGKILIKQNEIDRKIKAYLLSKV